VATLQAQTKFGDNRTTINPNSLVEMESTNKGLLLPRLTQSQRDAMTSVPEGMVIYNTSDSCINQFNRGKWNSLCETNNFCGVVMVGDNDNVTFDYIDPNTPDGLFVPADEENPCALYITEDGGTWIWNGTSYVTKQIYVEPWWDKATNTPASTLTQHLYHLGSANVGTGYAPGKYSMTIGINDTVTGNYSLSIEENNKTSGHRSLVVGGENKSIANRALVVGTSNDVGIGTGSLVTGSSNYTRGTGSNSIIGGNNDTIIALTGNVILGGQNNKIDGNSNSNVIGGYENIMTGTSTRSVIFGQYNLMDNSGYAAAFGQRDTVSNASYSIIGGRSNKVLNAEYAAVFGRGNQDSSSYSLVAGQGNIASSNMEHATVIGKYNQPIANALFTVGNGFSNVSRSNVFVVTDNTTAGGKVIYSAQLPSYATDAAADADAALPSGAFYKLTGSRAIYQKP
jgi:hypothetical protein